MTDKDYTILIKSAELERVCGVTSRLPDNELPEFAFAGKSNVGKSSLINALLNRRALARTSASPGKTQTINFYRINDKFYFVDLPGYGYTSASVSARAQWGRMVERYLKSSRALRKIFLLVDMRHKPTEDDKLMYDWILHYGFKPVVVATKADKLNKNDKPKAVKLIRETLSLSDDTALIQVSSVHKTGLDEIYKFLLDK